MSASGFCDRSYRQVRRASGPAYTAKKLIENQCIDSRSPCTAFRIVFKLAILHSHLLKVMRKQGRSPVPGTLLPGGRPLANAYRYNSMKSLLCQHLWGHFASFFPFMGLFLLYYKGNLIYPQFWYYYPFPLCRDYMQIV